MQDWSQRHFFLCKKFSHEISSRSIFLVEKIDEISNQHNAEEQFVSTFSTKIKRINNEELAFGKTKRLILRRKWS
jgi:hypothetical protein